MTDTDTQMYVETIRRLTVELIAANREIAKLRAQAAMRAGSIDTPIPYKLSATLEVVR